MRVKHTGSGKDKYIFSEYNVFSFSEFVYVYDKRVEFPTNYPMNPPR